MRQLGMSPREVARVVRSPAHRDQDENGNPRFSGVAGGRRIRVVLALDEPTLVKTVRERKSRSGPSATARPGRFGSTSIRPTRSQTGPTLEMSVRAAQWPSGSTIGRLPLNSSIPALSSPKLGAVARIYELDLDALRAAARAAPAAPDRAVRCRVGAARSRLTQRDRPRAPSLHGSLRSDPTPRSTRWRACPSGGHPARCHRAPARRRA